MNTKFVIFGGFLVAVYLGSYFALSEKGVTGSRG